MTSSSTQRPNPPAHFGASRLRDSDSGEPAAARPCRVADRASSREGRGEERRRRCRDISGGGTRTGSSTSGRRRCCGTWWSPTARRAPSRRSSAPTSPPSTPASSVPPSPSSSTRSANLITSALQSSLGWPSLLSQRPPALQCPSGHQVLVGMLAGETTPSRRDF